jgi:hypothetical protein
VFIDNRARALEGEPDLEDALRQTIELARERKSHR